MASLLRVPLAACASLLLAAAIPSPASETEWPQFRGPGGQGLSAAENVPIAWDSSKSIVWKQPIPGKGWSSPALSHGRLYLTSAVAADGGDLKLHALCLDSATGKILWDNEILTPDPASAAAMHRKNSPASPTPIVTKDRVFVHFGHMGTAALDLDGKIIWKQTGLNYTPVHGAGGSPALVGDLLVFSADAAKDPFVIALDVKDGSVKWKTPRNSPAKKLFSFCTPLAIDVAGAPQIISPGSGFVGAYNPADGKEIWRVGYGEGYSVVPRPVYAKGLLFVSSGFDQPVAYAIRPEGAQGDATATAVAWTHKKGAPCTPSMLVVGDELYFVSDGGIATCADATTGQVYWTERLGGDFSASPFAAEGRIYFQNENGIGFVVKAGKTYELLSKNELGERTLASAAVEDGAIYLRSENHLWKVAQPK